MHSDFVWTAERQMPGQDWMILAAFRHQLEADDFRRRFLQNTPFAILRIACYSQVMVQ